MYECAHEAPERVEAFGRSCLWGTSWRELAVERSEPDSGNR